MKWSASWMYYVLDVGDPGLVLFGVYRVYWILKILSNNLGGFAYFKMSGRAKYPLATLGGSLVSEAPLS